MIENLLEQIYEDAVNKLPRESCGLVIEKNNALEYISCRNESVEVESFVINTSDYAAAEDLGNIKYIVHSHPYTGIQPSEVDKLSLELDDIPWLIVCPHTKTYSITVPTGYVPPLLGREYTHGISDCLSIVLDYYKLKLNINLGTYYREDLWWLMGKNYYNEELPKAGFIKVTDGTLKEHDIILMRVASSIENHAAIYIGNNKILHHPQNRISTEDIYGGWWQKISSSVYRHSTQV